MQTLRPTETFGGDTWTVSGGAGSVHAALADDNPSTYAAGPDGSTPADVGLENLVGVPPGARITSVTARVTWSGDDSAMGAVATVDGLSGQYAWHTAFEVVSAAPVEKVFAMPTRPDGAPWTVDSVAAARIHIAGNTPALHFIAVAADVAFSERPVVSGVTPAGIVTTQQPVVGWVFANADGNPQHGWQARVFTLAQAAAGGFAPESSPATVDSGSAYYVASGAQSWTVPQALSPGVYRAYVRAAASTPTGDLWSDWASTTFTVVGDPPAPPALVSVQPDPAAGWVEIIARQSDNMLNVMTATADGVAGEYLRWFAYGNSTPPLPGSGGVAGSAVTASVAADGEWAASGVQPMRVAPGVEHIWAGQAKSGTAHGVVHLDAVWLTQSGTFISLHEGTPVLLGAAYQPSQGRAVPPGDAYGCLLMWRSTGPLAAGQALAWDACGIWPAREDIFLTDMEARLIAAEDAVVDLEVRVAALEGVAPTVTIQPGSAPLDAASYRGGLDSRNLLGPADASFVWTLAASNWRAGDPEVGHLESQPDAAGYEGYSLRYVPDVVGAAHRMRLARSFPIPNTLADYQFSLRHRASGANLTADPYLVWDDGDGNPVGAPVGVGLQFLTEGEEFGSPAWVDAIPPPGAARFHLEITLGGCAATSDRWVFDRFQVARLAVPPPDTDTGFGYGPFGYGPFGGNAGTGQFGQADGGAGGGGVGSPGAVPGAVGGTPGTAAQGYLEWKPASGCDVYPLAESSADGGQTWTPVRNTARAGYDPVTRLARIHDYEAPLGAPVVYRVRTAARDYNIDPVSGALVVSAPTTTRSAILTASGYHVVDPYTQVRLPFEHSAGGGAVELKMDRPRPQGEFSPVGRPFKLITQDVAKGRQFDWRIAVPDAGAWDALEAVLETGHTLLVQTPLGRSWYIKPAAWKVTTVLDGNWDHGAVIEFSCFEQERPADEG